ncbi:MAG: restriction endonuclease subunit S [Bacteroidales bacterium]|nr:restriction endonuclease subunit S [Bacteroidales bacterium]
MIWYNFSEIIKDKTGGNPKLKVSEYLNKGEIPVVDQGKKLISGFSNNKSLLYKFTKPLILFGDHTCIFKYIDFPFILGADGVKALEAKIDIETKYLYYFLCSARLPDTGYDRHFKYLKRIKIPLPPLETQQKIAAILDKADELIQNDKQILEKYDQLAQSVFLEMFGDPVTNSMKWNLSKLNELGIWKSGGTPSRQIAEYFNGDIPWLTSGELENIYTFESIEQICEQAIRESSAKLIEKDSLLLGMYDTAALKSTINKVECSCNQAIAFAKLDNKKANTVFVYYFIQFGKDFLRRMQRGVRQKNMNLSMIKNLQIFLPPIELQNRFAEIIKQIETQKQVACQSLQKSEELFRGLLQGVFRGELINE